MPDWPILRVGFRPFFLLAMAVSVFLMGAWLMVTQTGARLPAFRIGSSNWWHAHEMIYGYALAVAAGFLLTAVRNWTGRSTAHGLPLALLALLWLLGRALPWLPGEPAGWWLGACADLLFIAFLSWAVLAPLVRERAWARLGIVSKIAFFLPGQALFMLGAAGRLDDGERMGVMVGLYMLLSLMLVLARRLLPMFIARATGAEHLKQRRWVDAGCFALFLVFAVIEVFDPGSTWGTALAAALAVLHGIRLAGWHDRAIWRMPMLWVLYIAYAWMIVGFLLRVGQGAWGLPASLAIHAFTVGGIGMMTMGMMSRVTLGHTGRVVMSPPRLVPWAFALLLAAAIVRVAGPMWFPSWVQEALAAAQAAWMAAFALALAALGPMLWRERADGRWG